MTDTLKEIQKRRTFAIISHPDAGKTTLTERLLLYGGAIALAGSVKGKKASRHAVSDWMEIEKQRGISVTSSVMQFHYNDYCINILDTPGHQDFSEDTYRTLMAADSAVMVIDASKGVELQTRKLFKVCAMSGIPVFTFINKMDRESRDPYELVDEIEKELGIGTVPMNWPIGSGNDFKGVYDRVNNEVISFIQKSNKRTIEIIKGKPDQPEITDSIPDYQLEKMMYDTELLDAASNEFDLALVRGGKLSPVFFGSALTGFGVEYFLKSFLEMTTPPLARKSDMGTIDPACEDFSAFVFKIQANMNRAHRDRVAFMRVCSGRFDKGMDVYHMQGGKIVKLSQPQQLMAQEREIVDRAYAGDILGVFDPGIFSIGDTVCTPSKKLKYRGIPTFAPEHFAKVRQTDTLKRKQFIKGTTQIAQEGAIQIFKYPGAGMEEVIVGVVGVLQFEVLEYRLKNEYSVDIVRENLSYQYIRWIQNDNIDINELDITSDTTVVQDFHDRYLLLFTNTWNINWALEHNKGLLLSEFGI